MAPIAELVFIAGSLVGGVIFVELVEAPLPGGVPGGPNAAPFGAPSGAGDEEVGLFVEFELIGAGGDMDCEVGPGGVVLPGATPGGTLVAPYGAPSGAGEDCEVWAKARPVERSTAAEAINSERM